jgi:hypothetical protein
LASHFQMTSPLSRDELVVRLREQIDSPWTFFGKKLVVGQVSRSRLWLRKRTGYRNSFQTLLTATLSTADSGETLLTCRTGMSAFVIAFMCVWFGGVIWIGGLFVPPLLNGVFVEPVFLILPGMLLFGAGLVSFGRWLAKGEDELLVSFLEDTVDARR